MAKTVIKVLDNGPYEFEVTGGVEVVDAEGNAFQTKGSTIHLCRCGRSNNKPFCDGSHHKPFESVLRAK